MTRTNPRRSGFMNTPADYLKSQYTMHFGNCRLTLMRTLSMMQTGHL